MASYFLPSCRGLERVALATAATNAAAAHDARDRVPVADLRLAARHSNTSPIPAFRTFSRSRQLGNNTLPVEVSWVAGRRNGAVAVNQLGFSLGAIGFRREDSDRVSQGEHLCDIFPSTTDGKIA
jgi:hypothetical protein